MKALRVMWVACWAASAVLIAGCGGGGGDGGSLPPPPPPPPPVVTAPAITGQPADQAVTAGQTATFSVLASGSAPLGYQWRRNGADIAGAVAASYTTPATGLGDDGALFAVVVSNSAGSATSNNASLSVSSPPVSSGRYLEAWTSTDGNLATGSYTLGVVDPDAPTAPLVIDQLPASANHLYNVQRVRGGVYNPADGMLSDVGTRHLVYVKNGGIYRLSLDKGVLLPAAVRLSNETQVQTGSLSLVAQSYSGDDALFSYERVGAPGIRRLLRLSTPATDGTPVAPAYPGDLLSTGQLVAAIHDPATGAITGYLWPSFLATGGRRLYRTDADMGNPTSVGTYASSDLNLRLGLAPLTSAQMRGGHFFIADGALRRYDFASGNVHEVYPGVTSKLQGAVFDDDAIYLPAQTSSGPQLLKAVDAANSPAVPLMSGAPIGTAGLIVQQTRDYLVLITGSTGENAISVRKSDGLQTPLPSAGGIGFSWSSVGGLALAGGGASTGNRVFYFTITTSHVLGSVHADGSDRREHNALYTDVGALQSPVRPHRLATLDLGGFPMARLLVTMGQTRRWLNLASGDVGPSLGSVPSALSPGLACAKLLYRACPFGATGVLGYETNVPVAPGTSVPRLDAYFVSEQANSLLRLTNHIP